MKFTSIALLCALVFPHVADAETRYGSFLHDERIPKSLFLTGEIRQGDSFELRKALRDHDIQIVIMGSAGGNLYEGLQMGSILWDKGISTYVPVGANCESSCANMFFGGVNRKAEGQLGVHQFYSADRDKNAPLGVTEATAQYTMADVIGIMNAFNTPAFVYEKMLGTTEMYYFSEEEKARLALNSDEPEFLGLQALNVAFIYDNPKVIERPASSPDPKITEALAPIDPIPSSPTAPATGPTKPERYQGIDFFGSDIHPKGVRGISLEKCEQICTEDSSCAAWSYVHATAWCWPKSGVDNISFGYGITSGIVDSTRFDMSIFDRPFIEMTAADLPGNDILPRGMSNTTLDECRSACQASSSCRAFTWVGKKNLCFPKYAASKAKTFIGAISGVKR